MCLLSPSRDRQQLNDYLCSSGGANECPLLVSKTHFPSLTVCADVVPMPFDELEGHRPIYPPMSDQVPIDSYPDVQISPPSEQSDENDYSATSASPVDSYPEAEHGSSMHSDEHEQSYSSPSTHSEEASTTDPVTQYNPDETLYEQGDRALGQCIVKRIYCRPQRQYTGHVLATARHSQCARR